MTVHYTEERLSYLRSICKEFTSLGDIAKAYIFPNDAQKHCTIEAAIKYPGLEIQTLGPTPLGHPHLLAWCHQAKARELFHADPSISHFPYREDDIHITKANLIWWLQARNYKNTVPILAYYAMKCTPTPRSTTAAMSLPQPSTKTPFC